MVRKVMKLYVFQASTVIHGTSHTVDLLYMLNQEIFEGVVQDKPFRMRFEATRFNRTINLKVELENDPIYKLFISSRDPHLYRNKSIQIIFVTLESR